MERRREGFYVFFNKQTGIAVCAPAVNDFGFVCLRSFTETHDGIEHSLVADDL